MPTMNDNFERVLAVEALTLKNDWVASLGNIDPGHPGRIIDPDNTVQKVWANEPGKNLRVYGKTADISLAEFKNQGIRVIFFGQLYSLEPSIIERDTGLLLDSKDANSEYVLRAYLRWGEDVFHYLKGIYAIVIWDAQKELLICARDRVGNIPLFYSDAENETLISISIDAILNQPGVKRAVNQLAVAEFLCDRWIKPEETYQANVRRLLPGHSLKFSPAGNLHRRYWEPVPFDQKIEWITEKEVADFDDLLFQAVTRCVDNKAVGIFLSGGLDSVTVATLANDVSRKGNFPPPTAYSLIFPYPGANEEEIQRSVAAQLNIDHYILSLLDTMGNEGILKSALSISDTRPVPVLNLWVPGYQFLTLKAQEAGLKKILTGGGGDEWLGVSPYYAADLIRAFQLKNFYDYLVNVYDSFSFSPARLIYNVVWKYGARPVLGFYTANILRRIAPQYLLKRRIKVNTRTIPEWIAPDPILRQAMEQRYDEYITRTINKKTPPSLYVNDILESLDHPLVSMEYEESFEGGRRFGIQKLAPFQDFDLAEFLIRTPPVYLNKGRKSKGLVRDLLANRFPELGFDKQKKRAGTPFFRETLIREGKAQWDRLGGTPTLSGLGIVDKDKMDHYIHRIIDGQEPSHHAWFIWHSLCMDSWSKRNF